MSQDPEDLRVLDALGRAVPHVAPPADLRARVLAAATREAIEAPDRPAPAPVVAFPIRPATSSTAPAPASRWPWLLAAAAAFVAVGTSFGWISARSEIARLQETIAQLRANTAELLNVRADFDRERTGRERAASILSAGDVTYTALAGEASAASARARVYVSRTRGLLFAAEDLPSLPGDRVYQLWTIVGGKPVSNGVVDLAPNGRAQLLAEAPPGPADAFAVTIEPTGGVPAPTGARVLLGVPGN